MIWLYLLLAVVLWFAVSVWWFCDALGRKMGPDKWYDYILGTISYPPVIIIWRCLEAYGKIIALMSQRRNVD